jgi:hypothetical protein
VRLLQQRRPVEHDGQQRFLVNRAVSESDPPVTVIVNWPKLLRQ